MQKASKQIFIFLVVGMLLGCKTSPGINPVSSVPDWVKTTPRAKDRLCAIGASEPTYFKEDGKAYAAESARRELARSLNVTVLSLMVDVSTEKGSDIEEGGVSQVSSWASEAVLRNSEISEYWYDENGAASFNRKNIAYALACMPMESTLKEISLNFDNESLIQEFDKTRKENER